MAGPRFAVAWGKPAVTYFWMGVAGLLAIVFLSALTAHLREPRRVEDVLRDVGLPPVLSAPVLGVQAAVVALLLTAPRAGFLVAAGFLAVVSGAFVLSIALGRSHSDCGCFSLPHSVDGAFFLRNAALGGVALAGWYFGPAGFVIPGSVAAVVVGICGILLHRRLERAPTP